MYRGILEDGGNEMTAADSLRKKSGIFYTDETVARILTRWAVRTGNESVLEPSFGDGIFLREVELVQGEHNMKNRRLIGVDLDLEALRAAKKRFPSLQLFGMDFFSLSPDSIENVDVVLGNPPFVRFHHFTGNSRVQALKRSQAQGVELPGDTNAWAAFVAHSLGFLRPEGRIAMVVPYEITYAKYARPLLQRLKDSFSDIKLLIFDSPLFPELSVRTALLLCDGFGGQTCSLKVLQFKTLEDLVMPLSDPEITIPFSSLDSNPESFTLFQLPSTMKDLYTELSGNNMVSRLGQLADVKIGYVTGDNNFFHLSQDDIGRLKIPQDEVQLVLRKSSDLAQLGLCLRQQDLQGLSIHKDCFLFRPDPNSMSRSAASYIRYGERTGVSQRFKCRSRNPWFRVPGLEPPDLFLSSIVTIHPRMVANEAQACATNSVLAVFLREKNLDRATLSCSALTSLAQLSAEIEGHSLGGGALKFEPSEAKRWLLPTLVNIPPESVSLVDEQLRQGSFRAAVDLADEIFLTDGLGLSPHALKEIRNAIEELRVRRKSS